MKAVLLALSVLLVLSTPAFSKAFTAFKNSCNNSQVENGTRPVVKLTSPGKATGVDFDDYASCKDIIGIHSISISYKDRINSIAVTYRTARGQLYYGAVHGKPTSPVTNITLGPTEHIMEITGQTDGWHVTQLTFMTEAPGYDRRTYGPYGKWTIQEFSFKNYIIAFHGGAADSLTRIGVYGLPRVYTPGGYISKAPAFDDGLEFHIPPVLGIRKIMVWNGKVVDAIRIEYMTLGGGSLLGDKHGHGVSKNKTTIHLLNGDSLLSIAIGTQKIMDQTLVSKLAFEIKKKNGEVVTYGPFGSVGSYTTNSSGKVVGFSGNAGERINEIDVWYLYP